METIRIVSKRRITFADLLFSLLAIVAVSGCQPQRSSIADRTVDEENVAERELTVGSSASPADATSSADRTSPSPALSSKPESQASNSPTKERSEVSLDFLKLGPPEGSEQLRAEAERLIDTVTETFPSNPDAFEVQARMQLMLEEFDLAEASWNRALELQPDYIHALFGLGQIAMTRDEYPAAIERFRQVIDASPNYSEEVHHELAEAYHKQGETAQAVEVLSTYVESHPESAESYLRLGQELLGIKDFESARNAFESALKLMPEMPRAQEGLGRALVRLGEREKAKELLQAQAKARKNATSSDDPFVTEQADYSQKYKDVAAVFQAGNRPEAAMRILEKAVILDPGNMEAWSSLLGMLQRSNDMASALRMAKSMCEANRENAGAFFTSGILNAKAGNQNQAVNDLRSAIQLAPESHSGYEALARLLLQSRRDLAETVGLAELAVKYRGIAADHELLAQAWAVNGDLEKAQVELARAIELDPQNPAYASAMQQLKQFRMQQTSAK